jgi:hypothetical protein
MNAQAGEYRYFCSETFENEDYNYSTPSYDDSNYSTGDDCSDVDNAGYCDADPTTDTYNTDYSNSCDEYGNC